MRWFHLERAAKHGQVFTGQWLSPPRNQTVPFWTPPRHGSHQVQNKRRECDLIDKCESPSATRTRLPDTGFLDCTGWDRSAMILPGCTLGHIRARYVLQGYLIRNLMFGQRWAFLFFFFFLAIGGPFFLSFFLFFLIVSEMRFEDVIMLPKAREDFCMC